MGRFFMSALLFQIKPTQKIIGIIKLLTVRQGFESCGNLSDYAVSMVFSIIFKSSFMKNSCVLLLNFGGARQFRNFFSMTDFYFRFSGVLLISIIGKVWMF